MSEKFVDITMLGAGKLQRKLAKLDFTEQKKIVRKANRQAMKPVKEKAVQLVPKDSGRLAKSIKIRSKTRRGINRVMIVTGTREQLGIDPDLKGYYPAAIEFGYTKNGIHYPARSFLRQALTNERNNVIKDISTLIKNDIERVLK